MVINTICRKISKGAKRERRLGAYLGAIGDVVRAGQLHLMHEFSCHNCLKVGVTSKALYQPLTTRTVLSISKSHNH